MDLVGRRVVAVDKSGAELADLSKGVELDAPSAYVCCQPCAASAVFYARSLRHANQSSGLAHSPMTPSLAEHARSTAP